MAFPCPNVPNFYFLRDWIPHFHFYMTCVCVCVCFLPFWIVYWIEFPKLWFKSPMICTVLEWTLINFWQHFFSREHVFYQYLKKTSSYQRLMVLYEMIIFTHSPNMNFFRILFSENIKFIGYENSFKNSSWSTLLNLLCLCMSPILTYMFINKSSWTARIAVKPIKHISEFQNCLHDTFTLMFCLLSLKLNRFLFFVFHWFP